MSSYFTITDRLDFDLIQDIFSDGLQLKLSTQSKQKLRSAGSTWITKLINLGLPVYGINTGFGAHDNKSISHDDLGTLQRNLVMSHACGTGEEVPKEIVRLMLLLKIQGLSYGNSGVQVETVQRLIGFFNHDILPVIYQQGSLGASGDSAPLAHLSLPLIGEGEVHYEGKKQSAKAVLKKLNWKPIQLQSKKDWHC